MRIFITGGTGFIGRAVCEALRGHDLRVLTRDPARAAFLSREQVWVGELGDNPAWKNDLLMFEPEACLHLAWEGLPDYSQPMCQRNFEATMSLYSLLNSTRLVVTGTCWEYGKRTGCVTEDTAPDMLDLFPAYKLALRLCGQHLWQRANSPFIWVRPFFVYGPEQRPTSLLPSAYQSLKAGRQPAIKTPDAVNDFIHVSDVAEGLAKLTTSSAPPGVYNLGTGQPHRVRDAVNLLARYLDQPPVFPSSEQVGQGMWADVTKLRQATGWQPRLSLEEGIRRTVDVWRATP